MGYETNRKVFLFKIETTEGVNSAPVVGTDAILTQNFQPGFLDADAKVRALDRPYFGAQPEIPASLRRTMSFDADLAGSGVAATAPQWMKLNRVCAMNAGVVTGGNSVVQSPISASVPSATTEFNWGGLDLVALGVRGTVSINIQDDEYPRLSYTLLGVPPSALASTVALSAPDYGAWIDPVLACTENTSIELDGYALGVRSLQIDMNGEYALRSLINPVDFVRYSNRNPGGTLVAEVPTLSAKNYFTGLKTGATMPLEVIHGTVAGNIVQIDAPKLQLTAGITFSEEQGMLMMSMPFKLLPNAGNDEITITSR